MKVTVISDFTFSLSPENETDQALIDALDHAREIFLEQMERQECAGLPRRYENARALVNVSRNSAMALQAQAGREALGAIRQLARLFLRELAQDGLVQPSSSDP